MENKLVSVCVNYDILIKTTVVKVDEGDVWMNLNKEQYDRIKASYDTGKFKKMNEDIDISDLYEMFVKATEYPDKLMLIMDYPNTIAKWDFESLLEHQNSEITPEEQAQLDAIVDEYMKDADEAADLAYEIACVVCDLDDWMVNKGLVKGEQNIEYRDVFGLTIGCLDIAWPLGVHGRRGNGETPIALTKYTLPEVKTIAEKEGYKCFGSVEELKKFVEENTCN